MSMANQGKGNSPKAGSGKSQASCEPKQWPSSKKSREELKHLLAVAKETADAFHKKAQIELDSLHKPVTI